MFREINISKEPAEGEPKRRWYQSDYFDLFIFYFRHSVRADRKADREFVGMQLCYDIRRKQRTLEWKKEGGFSHHRVVKGGDTMALSDGHVKFIVSKAQYDNFCDGATSSPARRNPSLPGYPLGDGSCNTAGQERMN